MFFRSTLIAHKTARKPYFMGLVVHKEIINFTIQDVSEQYITLQDICLGVFFCENCGKMYLYEIIEYLYIWIVIII